MTGALIILAALVIVGGILYLHHRHDMKREALKGESAEGKTAKADTDTEKENSECCGLHMTCEKDSLLAAVAAEIEYYDDEELDAYRGRDADAYTEEEIEEFRDILLTLRPDDIAGWARSIQLRQIELPRLVKEEMLLIVSEERASRAIS